MEGVLIKRYKRFLADVEMSDGRIVTAHTPNTGSMKGCAEPGMRVWLSDSGNAKRKYPLGWELVEVFPGVRVGINTGLSNRLVQEAIETGTIVELQGYNTIRREVRYGKENSRIDLLLERRGGQFCYVEVKNVTLVDGECAYFPDAVTARGTKHLRELAEMVSEGHRAVIFYCVQRDDAIEVRPADDIDPEYGKTLRQSLKKGVEALAYSAEVTPQHVCLRKMLPIICPS